LAFSYAGSVAVVTGAASGIGAALSAALAARGADLALADRDAAGLRRVAEATAAAGRKVSQHAIDVADHAAVADLPRAILAAHGRVSILINNAGVALAGTFEEVRSEDFDWLMDVNFGGTVRMTRAFLPLLRREPDAALVNISSLFGLIAPPGQAAYAASKFAVRGFTEAVRHELEGTSVTVSCVHPGGIHTPIAKHARLGAHASEGKRQAAVDYFEKVTPTSPEAAAARILKGVEKREPRILIGSDARKIDIVQRLRPATYWKMMAKRASGPASGK
jgi:short-subunit dehydrogenase